MCPSVWDALASKQRSQNLTNVNPVLAQFIGNWLDKLKTIRSNENESNVQFAVDFRSSVQTDDQADGNSCDDANGLLANNKKHKKKKKSKGREKHSIHLEEAGLKQIMEELKPLVDCSFDLPKSQLGCQRLMGTNVVRLTDKSFMQELRRRIKDDYNAVLHKRIAVREAKEIERERTLAISCRSGCIPQTLAGRPVNWAVKSTSGSARSRAKLKTTMERNTERLIRQGIKWERERLVSYELEKKKLQEAQKRREQDLMVDRTTGSNEKYLQRTSVNLPKTQIEDSPATDNKLESILDLPGDEEKEEKERELSEEEAADDTDGGEEEELVHDDAQSMSRDKQDPVEQNKPEEKAEKTIREKPPVPVNAIVITEDGIMERLLAAETVDELYRVAEEIIGKTKAKRTKNLLSAC